MYPIQIHHVHLSHLIHSYKIHAGFQTYWNHLYQKHLGENRLDAGRVYVCMNMTNTTITVVLKTSSDFPIVPSFISVSKI